MGLRVVGLIGPVKLINVPIETLHYPQGLHGAGLLDLLHADTLHQLRHIPNIADSDLA